MSGYIEATRFPSLASLRDEFRNQADSRRYRNDFLRLCERIDVPPERVANDTIAYLRNLRRHNGVEDLLVIMRRLIATYHLSLTENSVFLYRSIKALPVISGNRLGYSFNRRRNGADRGVFIFLM